MMRIDASDTPQIKINRIATVIGTAVNQINGNSPNNQRTIC